ncbi:MAG: FAD-binding oxidoreductase [Candidatus Dadabacteria bacterium]|nr:MAG: FAD-binding oxidoreductase [Candidatus Dadabacteria bacterium]
MTDLLHLLDREAPEIRKSSDLRARRAWSRDCWPLYQIRYWERPIEHLPAVVAWPDSTEAVAKLYRIASEHGVSVTPICSGSGVVGGGVPESGGLVVDLKFLDRKLEIHGEDGVAIAEAGMNGQVLEDRLNASGYTCGHFPSSIMMSSPGGWLAARGAGQLSTRYGTFPDRVRGCRWVWPDGTIEDLTCDGANDGLLELLTGSEGTMGAATEVRFRIDPLPEARLFSAWSFRTVAEAVNAMRRLLQAGVRPAAVRLYDPLDALLHRSLRKGPVPEAEQVSGGITAQQHELPGGKLLRRVIRMGLQSPGPAQALAERLSPTSMLVLMFEGPGESVRWQYNTANQLLEGSGLSLGDAPARAWYQKRYSITGKQAALVQAGAFFDTMEVAFSWADLVRGYEAVRAALRGQVLLMAHISHVYPDGGCIYFTFTGYRPDRFENERHYREVWRLALDAVASVGGTVTHHHGVGVLKARWLPGEWQGGYTWLKLAKHAIDPQQIANPGKLGL